MIPPGEHGHIRVTGINTANAVAGYMLLCDSGRWRAVCDSGWGLDDARVVCRQLGFTIQGTNITSCSIIASIVFHPQELLSVETRVLETVQSPIH